MKKPSRISGSKTKKQRVIFIDWDGTLSPTNFWGHLEKSEKQADRNLFKLWADAMFVNHKDEIVPWMKGMYTSEDMLSLIAKETQTNFDTLLKEFIIGCEKMEYSTPNIPDIVKNLRDKQVIVCIATNNMDSFTRWTVPAMKLDSLFDEILNSFYLKALKHDLDENGRTLFFQKFFNKYKDIKPEDCTFFDDGEDKMGIINGLGIDYRRINASNILEQRLQEILSTI